MKRFLLWIGLKQTLHERAHKPPLVSEGDIWWASIGENVGSEVNGKSNLFSRPVIIYRKLAHGFYFVVPTTTQDRKGTWFVGFRQHAKIDGGVPAPSAGDGLPSPVIETWNDG